MSKMKEIYIEILNQFDGQIPDDFDFDKHLQQLIKEKNKKQNDKQNPNT